MDTKELQEKLDSLKAALEESLTKKAKSEIETQIKAVNEAIDKLKAEMPKADTETADKVKSLEADLKAVKEAAEKNQPVIDAMVVNKDNPTNKADNSWDSVVRKAVEDNNDDIEKFLRKEKKALIIEIKAVADFSTANVSGGTVYGAVYKPGIIPSANQIGHVRNFLNVMTAGPGTDYYFMRENGGEGAPAFTAEKKSSAATDLATGLKPQFDIDLVEASVKFETLAGWMLLSRKSMNNIPGFMNLLSNRVPEKLLDVEDANLLYGNGVSPNIKGILSSGNFTASTSAASVLVERIIDDISLLADTYRRNATAILMRPVAYYSFFKNKAGGSQEYDLPQGTVFVNGVLYICGIPAFLSTALNASDYIVGDFRNGADLIIQEGIRMEFFEQDSTNVRTNQVTLRVEETVAFPVYGSDYFVKGDADVS
jgi:HK97 family phage major capsid protein